MLVPHLPTWEKLRVTLLNIERKLLNEIYSVDNIIISDHAQGKIIRVVNETRKKKKKKKIQLE